MDHKVFHRPLSALNIRKAIFVEARTSLDEALKMMQKGSEPCLLIGEADNLEGIFTERDLLFKVAGANQREAAIKKPIAAFMTPVPTSLGEEETVTDALVSMAGGGHRHLPIHDDEDGVIIGIVSVTDIVDFLVIHFPDEILNPWFDINPGDRYG